MLEAFLWGGVAAGMLLLGAVIAFVARPGPKINAVIMAAGAGLLLGSVSYDLIEEAVRASGLLIVCAAFFLGAAVFVVSDAVLDHLGGAQRKNTSGAQADGSAKGIVLGSVLDGIPESFVLGLTVLQGGVSLPLLIGVSLSNLPEGMASSSGLRVAGWPLTRIAAMWSLVVLVSALSAAGGYVLLDPAAGGGGGDGPAIARAFAAGALLAMLSDTMLPEAFEEMREYSGAFVVLGFAASLGLAAL